MRRIKYILNDKKISQTGDLDEKSLFYVFQKIFKKEYGDRGAKNVKPKILKNKTLFLEAKNSNWANEVWMNKEELTERINKEIGSRAIDEIKIKS